MVDLDSSDDIEEKEDNIVGETSNYSKKSGFDKGAVVQAQVERCLIARGKDLTKPGYTTWIIDKQGNSHPKEIPDFRKEFIGSVEGLLSILSPEIMKDEDAKKAAIKFEENKRKLFLKYAYKDRIGKQWLDDPTGKTTGSAQWVYSNRIYMPELGAVLLDTNPESPYSVSCVQKPNLWDNYHNAYYQEMVEIASELFSELNILIDANGYFKGGSEW